MEDAAVKALTGMADKANKNIEEIMEDGDYIGEDGLLHCGKCHGKKQTRLNYRGIGGMSKDEVIVRCVCACEAERKSQEEKAKAHEEEMRRLERLRSASLIEDRLKNARLSTFERKKTTKSCTQ